MVSMKAARKAHRAARNSVSFRAWARRYYEGRTDLSPHLAKIVRGGL